MAANNRHEHKLEVDLEATAELPAIDFSELPDSQTATDLVAAPVIPAGMAELADSLRDVEDRLERKIERVSQLESSLRAAEQQIAEMGGKLQQQQASAATRETSLRTQLEETTQQFTRLQTDHAGSQGELAAARERLREQFAALTETQMRLAQRNDERLHQERDLAEWRRRVQRQQEALSTWQGFRGVTDALLGEGDQALRDAEARHAGELAAAMQRTAEVDSQLAAARADAAQRIAALEETVQRGEKVQQTQDEALRAAADRATALTTQLAARDASLAALQAQLDALRAESSQRIAELEQSVQRGEKAQQAQDEALRAAVERGGELSAQLAARDASMAVLQEQLAALRAVEERARQGAAAHDSQLRQIGTLQTDLEAAESRLRELEQKLRQSSERVQRMESEAHASAALLGNLQRSVERLGREDTGTRLAMKEAPADATVRVLIRQEGGAEVVYPLGRRTTIGRTAENDIQLDTSFISRHHAVLLSGADHCIVEDLNSTNGILVNGRRVGRQVLRDGDVVTVGKTEFRYQQRS